MKHLINIIEYLEGNHHYRQVDEMIKIALDMRDVLTEDNQQGSGVYGTFYSDFSMEEKQKLKNQLGNVPENVGVKQYKIDRSNKVVEIQNIKENLAFMYIAPYIAANTDLKTPVYNGSISLSGMISNRINITQKMPGVSILQLMDKTTLPGSVQYDIIFDTNRKIKQKLESIGVYWSDVHKDNYLIDNNAAKEFKTYIENNPELMEYNDFDLSRNAALFDFGGFNVYDYTPPAMQLLELKNKLEKSKSNSIISSVIVAIQNMIYDS